MLSNSAYEQIFTMVKNGNTSNPSMWDQAYDYLKQHPDHLFYIAPNHSWSIGHQIVYNGGFKLLQRLLQLYTEDTIDITSKTKEKSKPLTILDVARDRQNYYKEQYEYIDRLFLQDKFLRACQELNWPLIDDILEKNEFLLNEKPPYFTKYFIHYIVEFGDPRRIIQYDLPKHQFRYDLQDSNGKTALQLAQELGNDAMVQEIKQNQPPPKTLSLPVEKKLEKTEEKKEKQKSMPIVPPRVSPPKSLTDEALKFLTCPLTKKIFSDPVIASDGCTYERKAILHHLQDNRYSPIKDEPIEDKLTENTLVKQIIQDFRQQKLIPNVL